MIFGVINSLHSKLATLSDTGVLLTPCIFFQIRSLTYYVIRSIGRTCMFKGHLKRLLSSSPCSSVGKASGYKSQGYAFESHCRQGFSFCIFRYSIAPDRPTEPIQMKSSMAYIRRKRTIKRKMAAALVPCTG